MIKQTPSLAELLEQLRYDSTSGKLFWNLRLDGSNGAKSFNGKLGGKEAGTATGRNYLIIKIDGTPYYAHRLVWKLVTGNEVVGCIDHIDGNPGNNKFENLRDVTLAQNAWNTKLRAGNSSGFRGVSFNRKLEKWIARIRVDGEQKYLGIFESPLLAHAAFVDATSLYRDGYARVA